MKPETKKLLAELNNTSYGIALKEFLGEELERIGGVENCEGLDEMLGRKHAIKLIKNIFSFMDEKKQVEKNKNSYV